ncbi:hypothetical protein PCANB_002403 [Pneumocystis canis]|nr:hypothetical protein PCANB_002403 [Pneumocystis canis]
MTSIGTGYDLSNSTFSPDGRIFQVEYACKAIENSGIALGIKVKDGVVLVVEHLVQSKLLVPGSNKRIYTIDNHIGVAIAGLNTDGKHFVSRAREEAKNWRDIYRTPILSSSLTDRMANYVQVYTLYSSIRPFGASCIIASIENNIPKLFMIEPSGNYWGYNGTAIGKSQCEIKNEIEKLKLNEMCLYDAVKAAISMYKSKSYRKYIKISSIRSTHNESKDKEYEIEASWIGFSETKGKDSIWEIRKKHVKEAFLHSWEGYKKNGWGKDKYNPVSKTGSNNILSNGAGWIIIDSLDTLYIMGLYHELHYARDWINSSLDFDQDEYISTFEATIRMLGGLLSAYFLTKDNLYLIKATDLSNRLLNAFNSPSGIPYSSVNLHNGNTHIYGGSGYASTAEAATLQLEFKYLSFLIKSKKHWDKVEKVMKVIKDNNVKDGLVSIFINIASGKFENNYISLGSRGDSYYEYLIKQYLLTQKEEKIYLEMFEEAVEGIKKHMIKHSKPSGFTFVAELPNGINNPISPRMEHLACFLGGTLALGAKEMLNPKTKQKNSIEKYNSTLKLAEELTRTCFEMYNTTASKLSPEIVYFNLENNTDKDILIDDHDAYNLQRPETAESLFILWRITKNETYRDWGWIIFKGFQNYAKVEGGYTSIKNVLTNPPIVGDNMESFWLAETLKWLYLLFSPDDILPLDEIVFNTEAHPFPRFSLKSLNFNAGWITQ